MWDGTQDLGRFLIAHGVTEEIANHLKKTTGWSQISDLKYIQASHIEALGHNITRKEYQNLMFLSYWVKLEGVGEWTHEKESRKLTLYNIWKKHRLWVPPEGTGSSFANPYLVNM